MCCSKGQKRKCALQPSRPGARRLISGALECRKVYCELNMCRVWICHIHIFTNKHILSCSISAPVWYRKQIQHSHSVPLALQPPSPHALVLCCPASMSWVKPSSLYSLPGEGWRCIRALNSAVSLPDAPVPSFSCDLPAATQHWFWTTYSQRPATRCHAVSFVFW